MTNHPNRSKKTRVFIFQMRNGFGSTTEQVRARNLDHALAIFAFRVTNARNCCVRRDGKSNFTLFGPVSSGGHNLGRFECVQAS